MLGVQVEFPLHHGGALRDAYAELMEACRLNVPPDHIRFSEQMAVPSELTEHGHFRDYQRDRFYEADQDFRTMNSGAAYASLEQMQNAVDRWTGGNWFVDSYGEKSLKVDVSPYPDASFFEHGDWADDGRVFISHGHMHEQILIHEVAHSVPPLPHSPHGALFCAVYFHMTRCIRGLGAAIELQRSFDKFGVRYGE